ncbi:thiolase family protein [Saccharospirillum mangrovi]|uniref:thiolase family protein n=1 Tax=Saccharospirillum mangrovi TaxID=2161747 RepID=UPI000D36F839|nr:thiolase family protein [Saccharospirillum mangrovi]
MNRPVYLVAARRTPVAPVGGAFKKLAVTDLAVPVLQAIVADAGLRPTDVEQVILGNALYGGGNPARTVALAAGLDEAIPAFTLDTQCCSGLDAIRLGTQAVAAGQADVVIAGGVESTSRRAIRLHRPTSPNESPIEYERPPFTPWPERDPDMADAAAKVADQCNITLDDQIAWAIHSHQKALAARAELEEECVAVGGLTVDSATRPLTEPLARRTPVIARRHRGEINVAGTALSADAAAACVLVSETVARRLDPALVKLRWIDDASGGGRADCPPEAPVPVARTLLDRLNLSGRDFAAIEWMEAYAAQVIANAQALELPIDRMNRGGGALARGHPIAASGAILAVRAYSQARQSPKGFRALLAIAAAGGLASAAVLATD